MYFSTCGKNIQEARVAFILYVLNLFLSLPIYVIIIMTYILSTVVISK